MKKILFFVIAIAMSFAHADAAVRDGNTTQRNAAQKRISTTTQQPTERSTTARTTILGAGRNTVNRTAQDSTNARHQTNIVNRATTNNTRQPQKSGISVRAATTPTVIAISETRTGAAYESCKSAFFTCMDQFCALKNDDYRRCSCSNRISSMEKQRATLNDVGEQLTVFTENLDVVGLTAAQATAMRTASEGESALSKDTSASKALLQAIMNSISGGDTTVGGKYSDLNTINMSYDLSTVFGLDTSQVIASYNGQELYSAVYPQCRKAVAEDCNNASLQRAVNAYLMAIEQDCNTVQTAIEERQSQMKAAIREGSAMLDLARVENRRKHNSDTLAECINNVETAILSEEVCGANYHKCLDNGEFIDISTGAPITGVVKFYELGKQLTFNPGVDAANQQLSKRADNRVFVSTFEKRTKKFAEPALDKCREIADEAWAEYLDKALLAIYYAQQSKVAEIKQGCFDFVSSCYMDSDTSITAAMAELIGSGITILQPDKIALTTQMCADYVDSCNNMFAQDDGVGNIIEDYINNRQDTDTLTACRAIVKQCFDKYGGSGYENFYYPYSGLFNKGSASGDSAGRWFTLYDKTVPTSGQSPYLSPCAIQLTNVAACSNPDMIEQAFGGFDLMHTVKNAGNDATQTDIVEQLKQDQLSFRVLNPDPTGQDADSLNASVPRYGLQNQGTNIMQHRVLRPVGVATEVYNQIVDTLTIQCTNINGRFVERQFIKENLYGGKRQNNLCLWYPQQPEANDSSTNNYYQNMIKLANLYGIFPETYDGNSLVVPERINDKEFIGENMCPRDYNLNVDTSFWGACLCWENGARRSKNGKNATCVPEMPAKYADTSTDPDQEPIKDRFCYTVDSNGIATWQFALSDGATATYNNWCTHYANQANQVCPFSFYLANQDADDENSAIVCKNPNPSESDDALLKLIPKALE